MTVYQQCTSLKLKFGKLKKINKSYRLKLKFLSASMFLHYKLRKQLQASPDQVAILKLIGPSPTTSVIIYCKYKLGDLVNILVGVYECKNSSSVTTGSRCPMRDHTHPCTFRKVRLPCQTTYVCGGDITGNVFEEMRQHNIFLFSSQFWAMADVELSFSIPSGNSWNIYAQISGFFFTWPLLGNSQPVCRGILQYRHQGIYFHFLYQNGRIYIILPHHKDLSGSKYHFSSLSNYVPFNMHSFSVSFSDTHSHTHTRTYTHTRAYICIQKHGAVRRCSVCDQIVKRKLSPLIRRTSRNSW